MSIFLYPKLRLLFTNHPNTQGASSTKYLPSSWVGHLQQKGFSLWCWMWLRPLPKGRRRSSSSPWILKLSLSPRGEELLKRAVLALLDNWCHNKTFGLVPGEGSALRAGTMEFFKRSCSLNPSWDLLWELYRQAYIFPRGLRQCHY